MSILIGIVTHAGHKHCRHELVQLLEKLKQEVVIITNSGEEDKDDLEKTLKNIPNVRVLLDPVQGTPTTKIISGRNMLREIFLEGSWSHLYMLDSDVFGPENQLKLLASHNVPIASGWYLSFFPDTKGRIHVRPVVYGPKPGYFCRQLHLRDVLHETPFPIVMAGLGCCLIERNVLEKIPFRQQDNVQNGGEDTAFFVDAANKGFSAICDPCVRCLHLRYSADDPRTTHLDPYRYSLLENHVVFH